MKCPNCNVSFHPQMMNFFRGRNSRGANVHVFFQLCAECKEPIVGVKEQQPNEYFVGYNDIKGLTLMVKQKK